jgi:hypothetical protein
MRSMCGVRLGSSNGVETFGMLAGVCSPAVSSDIIPALGDFRFKGRRRQAMDNLIFLQFPEVRVGGAVFVNTPIPIRYEDTPMLEIVQEADGYSPHIPIFHQDRTKLAVARNGRLFLTEEGKKANLIIRKEDRLDVCELDGKTLYEIRRTAPASLSTSAELYAPDGSFLRWSADEVSGWLFGKPDAQLIIGGLTIQGGARLQSSGVGLQIGETSKPLGTAIFLPTAKGVNLQIG